MLQDLGIQEMRESRGKVKQISEPVTPLHTAGASSCKRGRGRGSEFPARFATQPCGQSISPGNGVHGNMFEKPWYKALGLPVPVSSGRRAGGSDQSETIASSTLCPVPVSVPNESVDKVWGSASWLLAMAGHAPCKLRKLLGRTKEPSTWPGKQDWRRACSQSSCR